MRINREYCSVLEAMRVEDDLWVATCGAFCFLKTEEEASSTIVWSRDQNYEKHAEHQANVRHFELSRKRIAARMSLYESHFVYELRSWPLGRDLELHAFGARSRLITADKI